MPNPSTDPAVYLTALPNGTVGGKLQVTLLFTPSLPDGSLYSKSRFSTWLTKSPFAAVSQWVITVDSFDASGNPVPFKLTNPSNPNLGPVATGVQQSSLDQRMWDAIFNSITDKSPLIARIKPALSESWNISHDAAHLSTVLDTQRLDHFRSQIFKVSMDVDTAEAANQTLDLYLRPSLQSESAASMAKKIQRRQNALDFRSSLTPTPSAATQTNRILTRITRALAILEPAGDQLCELGIYALYLHCVRSALATGANSNETTINGYLDQIKKQASSEICAGDAVCNSALGNSLSQSEHIIQFLLFSRRKRTKPMDSCQTGTQDPPDFHQILGFVNRYPTLLRPLGLAVDLEIASDIAAQFPASGTISLSPLDPTTDDAKLTISFQTAFDRSGGDFVPLSRYSHDKMVAPTVAAPDGDKLLFGRFLWINAQSEDPAATKTKNSALFTITSHDTEGSLHKRVASSESTGRGNELSPTPGSTTKSAKVPPSERSLGITLLHSGRADRLSTSLQNPVVDAKGNPRMLLADDLILGYRVDAKRDTDSKWFNLCDRSSKYLVPGTKPYEWEPKTGPEIIANEGFITLGATTDSAATTDDPDDPKLRFHQSIFTWNGWNLSVPVPFATVNSDQSIPDSTSTPVFAIKATHSITGPSTQLPLRFDQTYSLRCRVVDLAGNSIVRSAPIQPDDAVLKYKMGRHEPIRPPHILLDEPIIRAKMPGDHIDQVVLRDGSSAIQRVLVPPRENLRLAELHNMLRKGDPPNSAFPKAVLLDDGSFPTVSYAYNSRQRWFPLPDGIVLPSDGVTAPPELQDPIFHLAPDPTYPPSCGFYPDPLARYVRILVHNTTHDGTATLGPYWLDYFPYDKHKSDPNPNLDTFRDPVKWPQAAPCRIRVVHAEPGKPVSINAVNLPFVPGNESELRVQGLEIALPQASTLSLHLSSAAWNHDAAASDVPAIATATSLALCNLLEASGSPIYPRDLLQPSSGGVVSQRPTLVPTLYPVDSPAVQQAAPQLLSIGDSKDALDGSVHIVSPVHRMTVIHAVKKPLDPPAFASFSVARVFGQPVAAASGSIHADWKSTSAVACKASWTDCIDDVTKPCPENISHHEVAFSVALKDLGSNDTLLNQKHLFRDTRAHAVKYTVVGTSSFKSFYPAGKADDFDLNGATQPVPVKSSVRPPAPVVAYIIPAFQWQQGLDKQGVLQRIRVTVLRIYLERPFLISGDNEGLGIVLSTGSADPFADKFVSHIGKDPIRQPSTATLPASQVTRNMFPVDDKHVTTAYLAEAVTGSGSGGKIGVVTYTVSFSQERQLWFCDVPFLPVTDQTVLTAKKGIDCPFLRLGLVRWQPDSLPATGPADDPSISPVVIADFIQVASNRWCSIQRSGKKVTITLSGASYIPRTDVPDTVCPAETPAYDSQLNIELQHRWHSVGKKVSWRPVTLSCDALNYLQPVSHPNGIVSRQVVLTLPHSPDLFKYRVLLKEMEYFNIDKGSTMQPADKPSPRTTYFDFIEI